MTTSLLKTRINRKINKLPHNKLQVVEDFVSYLSDRDEENEAIKKLLNIPGLLSEVNAAKKEFASGKVTDWRSN